MANTLTHHQESIFVETPSFRDNADQHLRDVLAVHLDPQHGSQYWLQRQSELGFDIRDRIREMPDLARLGLVEARSLSSRSVWDFVPRTLRTRRQRFVAAETGGTTGAPVPVVYLEQEFRSAFIEPFAAVARQLDFPRDKEWLFIGPSGPHIIGKAARELATCMNSPDPWTVDFDPRWAKKLLPGSLAAKRYLDHVVQQSLAILQREEIAVLFATPPVLRRLVAMASERERATIQAVHYGGMAIAASEMNLFREAYPNAVHFSGYGNTLFGCALEVQDEHRTNLDYFPRGMRLAFQVRPTDQMLATSDVGSHGQLVFHRLDHSMLLVGVLERDWAELVKPSPESIQVGCHSIGIRNPAPPPHPDSELKLGIY